MFEKNVSPHPKDISSSSLLIGGVVIGAAVVIGLALFLLLWHVSLARTTVTAFVLFVPRGAWLLIFLAIGISACIGFWYWRIDTETQEEQGQFSQPHQKMPSATEASSALVEQKRISPVPDPFTPLPETFSGIERLLQPHMTSPQQVALSQENEEGAARGVQQKNQGKPEKLIRITLLKELTMTILSPQGKPYQVPINSMTKRAHLLAYLAVRCGEMVHRDTIIHEIFEWKSDDATSDEEMGGKFHSHVKLMRADIKAVVDQINQEAGEQLIDPNLDPFVSTTQYWGISPLCEVVDIEQVEAQHRIIETARKQGLLIDTIPLVVKEACEHLIAAYPGDFIEGLIKKSPMSFQPWEGKASWAKPYTTHLRSCFLDATWLRGEFEEQHAQKCSALSERILRQGANDPEVITRVPQLLGTAVVEALEQRGDALSRTQLLLDAVEREMRLSYGRAIEPFKSYALNACWTPYYKKSPYDERVSYNTTTRRFGDRITASEQALRRCLKACAYLGNTHEANEIYASYEARMSKLMKTWWGLVWQPSKETQEELASVRALTDGHRFSSQIAAKQVEH